MIDLSVAILSEDFYKAKILETFMNPAYQNKQSLDNNDPKRI